MIVEVIRQIRGTDAIYDIYVGGQKIDSIAFNLSVVYKSSIDGDYVDAEIKRLVERHLGHCNFFIKIIDKVF
jgi:hypothetical protein